jgi:ankyrin repeat protein
MDVHFHRRRLGWCLVSFVVAAVPIAMPSAARAQDARLVAAAAAQDTAAVRALLETGIDPDTARADGATALLWASHRDDIDLVDLLLEAGANVNAADDHGVTPLHQAAENASPAMVDRLLQAGADADAAQASGLTALMIAARTGNVEVVDRLAAQGVDVDAATAETRSTALMWAVAEGHPRSVRALLDAGANPHASTAAGFTPLLFAARNGDIPMARLLIAAGVDVNHTGADRTHALPYAIVRGHDGFARFLLDEGANPNGRMGGIPALHAAVGRVGTWLADWNRRHGGGARYSTRGSSAFDPARALPLVKALLGRGADPNGRITTSAMFMSYIGYPTKGAFEPFAVGTGDLAGATPLWIAAYSANARVKDIRFGRPEGAGAVVGAASRASAELLRMLLAAGADPHLTTEDGTTPLMAAAGLGRSTYTPREPRGARSPGAERAVAVLIEAGADVNAVNEAGFTALHGAAFRGLNEVIDYLVAQGADIDARDFRGRTAYRMAEGSKQSFQFQSWPETAAFLEDLGANPRLGIPGTVQERLRDVPATLTADQ